MVTLSHFSIYLTNKEGYYIGTYKDISTVFFKNRKDIPNDTIDKTIFRNIIILGIQLKAFITTNLSIDYLDQHIKDKRFKDGLATHLESYVMDIIYSCIKNYQDIGQYFLETLSNKDFGGCIFILRKYQMSNKVSFEKTVQNILYMMFEKIVKTNQNEFDWGIILKDFIYYTLLLFGSPIAFRIRLGLEMALCNSEIIDEKRKQNLTEVIQYFDNQLVPTYSKKRMLMVT
jgi:hypothetical protein